MSDGQDETKGFSTRHRDEVGSFSRQTSNDDAADPRYRSAALPDATEDFLFHLYRGSELLQDNRMHEAKEELERALHLQPRDAKGQDLLAVVYFRLGLYPRAIEIYEELTRAFPNELALTQNLALSYLKTGQAEKARTLLEQLVMAQPELPRAWAYLGLAFERLGDYEKARAAFERAGQPGMARRMADRRTGGSLGQSLCAPTGASLPAASTFSEIDSSFVDRDMSGTLERTLSNPVVSQSLVSDIAAEATVSSAPTPPSVSETGSAFEKAAGGKVPSSGDVVHAVASASEAPPSVGRRHSSAVTRPAPWHVGELAHGRRLAFPAEPGACMHTSGTVLVQVKSVFAVRGSCLRATSADGDGFRVSPLSRKARGRTLDEQLGGVGDPLLLLSGWGYVVLGPHEGHKLVNIELDDESIYLHERALVAFDGGLSCESGRIGGAAGGQPTPVAQLRGHGGAVFEVKQDFACLDVTSDRGAVVEEQALVGWTGRLISRPLEEPEGFGPRGRHFALAGDGTVFMSLAPAMPKWEGPLS